MELPAEPVRPGEPRLEATRPPALALYWWLTAVRGLVALTLALAIVVAGRGTDRLVTFVGLYWMAGGLITLRVALAIRPRRGDAAGPGRWRGGGRRGAAAAAPSTEVQPEVLWPVAAAWGLASGGLLIAEGLRLRRFAHTFRP